MLTIEFDDREKCWSPWLTCDSFLDPGLLRGKTLIETVPILVVSYINYSTFPSRATTFCNVFLGDEKFKLFSASSGFTGQIFTGELNDKTALNGSKPWLFEQMQRVFFGMVQKYKQKFNQQRPIFFTIVFLSQLQIRKENE